MYVSILPIDQCTNGPPCEVTFLNYIATSKQLKSLRTKIITSHTPINIDATIADIETIKHIKLNRIERANTTVCLQSISNIHSVISKIENTKKHIFQWKNPSHYALIDRYWTSMFPNVRRAHDTISEEWSELGFQGKDPSTDFRGMGMFGLLQLEYFASSHPGDARRILADSMHPRRYYPFSATGINITAFVLEMLRENRLHSVLLRALEVHCLESRSSQMSSMGATLASTSTTAASPTTDTDIYTNTDAGSESGGMDDIHEHACLALHEVYCEVFIAFSDLWVQRDPPNIMSFAGIFEEVKCGVRARYPAVGARGVCW